MKDKDTPPLLTPALLREALQRMKNEDLPEPYYFEGCLWIDDELRYVTIAGEDVIIGGVISKRDYNRRSMERLVIANNAAKKRCPTDEDLNAHAEAGGLLDQQGRWRLVEDPFGGCFPWAQFQLVNGEWVWPDCGYSCSKCGACLGCERKLIREHSSEGTWHLNLSPSFGGCDEDQEHECSGKNEGDDEQGWA